MKIGINRILFFTQPWCEWVQHFRGKRLQKLPNYAMLGKSGEQNGLASWVLMLACAHVSICSSVYLRSVSLIYASQMRSNQTRAAPPVIVTFLSCVYR